MSTTPSTPLPQELCRAIDAACDAFEQAWMRGERPVLDDRLGCVSEAARPLLLAELVRIELEWRCRRGESVSAEEYRTRFPACAATLDDWLAEAREAAAELPEHQAAQTPQPAGSAATTLAPGPAPPMAGQPRIVGEYELLELLGAGGMGEVYRARHRRLDKRVALKLLPAGAHAADERVQRFLREMKAVGSLEHANLVEAHDAGEHQGVVYLAMKLIDGIDLDKLVRQRGPLPIAEACELARQAALGLEYLHGRGLVHRDLKPSNLMQTPQGVVKVLDLGLARWRDGDGGEGLTASGQVMGTPDYLAPEQVEGTPADARADLYSLGCTLFYLLTGRPPFAHRKQTFDKLVAHVEEAPPAVQSLRAEVPAALAVLVGRLLSKKPEDRPQTAVEVAAALAEFARPALTEQRCGRDGRAPASRSAAVPAASASRSAAVPAAWKKAAAAGLLAAVLLGLGAWAWLSRPRPTLPDSSPNIRAASTAAAAPAAQAQPRPLTIDLRVLRCDPDAFNIEIIGELGHDVFRVRRDEPVTVEAVLSEPAYAYLIAFNPADKPQDLEHTVPKDEANTPPEQRTHLASRGRLALNDGEGLQVLAVVASRQKLPAYAEWTKRRPPLGWRRTPATKGVVWKKDAAGLRPLFDPRFWRAEEVDKADDRMVVSALADKLAGLPGIEAVALVGFAVVRLE